MIKKFIAITAIIGMLVVLPGCSGKSNVQTWSDNQSKTALYTQSNKSKSIKYGMEALQNILGVFEKKAVEENLEGIYTSVPEIKAVDNGSKVMFSYTSFGTTGKINGKYELADITAGYVQMNSRMIDYMIQRDINSLELRMAETKERVVVAFQPIFEQICKEMEVNGNPPKSWIDVASEFVKHVPMMATMGAMYGITANAIDAAGSTINATLSDNAKFNNSSVKGMGNSNNVGAGTSGITTDDDTLSSVEGDISNHRTETNEEILLGEEE